MCKLDHKEIGKQLDIFCFSENVGKGLPMWLNNGVIIRDELISYLKKIQLRMGYQSVISPHIGNKKLYEISGHYEKYKDHSFGEISCPDGESYMLKPMNCPHHCQIYKNEPRSYRDLPLRLSEFGQVYRYEDSGSINGLLRARGFCQDDAHLFCMEDQVESEISKIIQLVIQVFNKFNFKNYKAQISLRDNSSKYIGSDDNWNKSEKSLIDACIKNKLEYNIEKGEAAFYGPKIDFMVNDSLGREWQLGSIQLDYNLPERFDLLYVGSDSKMYRPVMIHRAPFGSLERFIAILLEESQGNLPFWISPIQVSILSVSEKSKNYASSIHDIMLDSDIRAKLDNRNERLDRKILDSKLYKVPYIVVIGKEEESNGYLSIRDREDNIYKMNINNFLEFIKK